FRDGLTNDVLKKVLNRGGKQKANLPKIKGAAFTINAGQARALANEPLVDYIAIDRPVRRSLDKVGATVGADIAFSSGYTGKGIGIAVIDSGVDDTTADLNDGSSRVVYKESFLPNDSAATDDYGHG